MTSLLTNTAAMNALATLRQINADLEETEGRISSGLEVTSGKDNAAYYQISSTMSADSAVNDAINDGLEVTAASLDIAEQGAQQIQDYAEEFQTKAVFTASSSSSAEEVENDLLEIVKQMELALAGATNKGDDMLGVESYANVTATADVAADGTLTVTSTNADTTVGQTREVTAGTTRAGGTYSTITVEVQTYDLASEVAKLKAIAGSFSENATGDNSETYLAGVAAETEEIFANITSITTKLGQSSKTIENQQTYLSEQSDTIDTAVGSMIDADLEEESARLSALQTQQELATQALSIANESTSSVMTLFQ
jgi:flagellin